MAATTAMYEVLDEAGHKTGKILDRETVHKQQLWHEVVNIWIMNHKGEVLLQLRSPEVELSPNVWDVAVGTHLRPHEDPAAAAQRGLSTELGLSVAPTELRHLFNIQAANPMPNGTKHRVLGHVFLLQQELDPANITFNPNKIAQLAWKPLEQIVADIGDSDTARHYFPREGTYYPQLFDALMAAAPPELGQ
ncbi:MAG TPA: NUDIX domain-containing protein [Candidatus Saccharimonadales bacterium]|nr:NUDIX domain-containing protein [Candidatus Saccharimonadales bacterium]